MSKTTDDLIDRIQGAATALRGVRGKLSPPASGEPAPPPEVAQEDFSHAKQVVSELKSNVEQLEAEISRESKVPEAHAAEGKTKSKI